ncbi:hypothetical protein [Amycolatopsis rubida]|uniref:Uncharacterized protein n=1 Tax=Amycolatopsis rubida TaxID=112413 RepID=A0A1I5IJ87_9PSEU|nr:hypothetical protein [Amycolatopsis rubida]SFO60653.1 hypothetical protein SAMN05421854_102507 [Amycolatopsis rubida]
MSDPNTVALRVAALKHLKDRIDDAYNAARAEQAEAMPKGARWPVVSPLDGVKLGTVSKSDPKVTASVRDETAFGAWAAKHYPDDTEYAFRVVGSEQEVHEALYTHAPHLVKSVTVVSRDLRKRVERMSATTGVPTGPGGELDVPGVSVGKPDGVVSCLPAEGGWESVVALVRADAALLELLARPAGEIEAGGDAS